MAEIIGNQVEDYTELQSARDGMTDVLETLRENLVPTVNTFITLVKMLQSIVAEIEELGPDSATNA